MERVTHPSEVARCQRIKNAIRPRVRRVETPIPDVSAEWSAQGPTRALFWSKLRNITCDLEVGLPVALECLEIIIQRILVESSPEMNMEFSVKEIICQFVASVLRSTQINDGDMLLMSNWEEILVLTALLESCDPDDDE